MAADKTDQYSEAYQRAKARVKSIKGFYKHLVIYLLVNAFFIVSEMFHFHSWDIHFTGYGHWSEFSLAIFWGIGLFAHFLNVFIFRGWLGEDWEQRKIKEIIDKDQR